MKKITFSVDEELISKARARAAGEGTTLNKEFRRWLEKYANTPKTEEDFAKLMRRLEYVKPGRSFSRDEMNENISRR